MREARELVRFYDARGWNWESALAFVLCRDIFGGGVRMGIIYLTQVEQ